MIFKQVQYKNTKRTKYHCLPRTFADDHLLGYVCNALNQANRITLDTDGHGNIPSESTLTTYYTVNTITRIIMGLCGFATLVIMIKLRIKNKTMEKKRQRTNTKKEEENWK